MPLSAIYRWSGRCRQAAYRARVKAEAERIGLRVAPTLTAVKAAGSTSERNGDAETHSQRVRVGSKPSGRQVSYRKTFGNLQERFVERASDHSRTPLLTPKEALNIALAALDESLSARQRERLEERRAAA